MDSHYTTVILAAVAYVEAAVKTYGAIQDDKVINKEIRLLQKNIPRIKRYFRFYLWG